MELKATITAKGAIFDGKAPEIIHKKLLSAMHEATKLLERDVKENTPQGVYGMEGGLRSTIHGEVLDRGASVRGIVGTQSLYGQVIEEGRRPGQKMPPGAAAFSFFGGAKHGQRGYEGGLIRWIEVKLGVDQKEAARLEFVIRRKIGKMGFHGTYMFLYAFERNQDRLKSIFNEAGFDIATELSGDGR